MALLIASVSIDFPSPTAPNRDTSYRPGCCACVVAIAATTSAAIQCVLRMSVLSTQLSPHRTAGIPIRLTRFALDCAAVARRGRRHIAAAANDDGIDEVFVKMIDELRHTVVHAPGHGQIVPHRQVLDEFAQPDAACVRADGNAELHCHEND